MERWLVIDFIIMMVYGLQHTLLTTQPAVNLYKKVFPGDTWNMSYSVFSLLTLIAGFYYWEPSGIYLFHLTPGSLGYHLSLIVLSLSLFFFFYCFRYTTSFWQWLGVKQIISRFQGVQAPEYYRVRQEGIKKYIRFPHHTCLIVLFWSHPVMTADTLFLAIGATIYLYLGTWHQDLRGLSAIGAPWAEYRKNTALLIPGPKIIAKMINHFFGRKNSKIYYSSSTTKK
ncbi:hypothetical protein [Alcanivorax sp.]|uniref:hypothetical protein n=1 Tax=Alcanivorax sp. TaxID=1872427 RepID=UPI002B277C53|nr:hypothetical protein [Alcanivorax sp.]